LLFSGGTGVVVIVTGGLGRENDMNGQKGIDMAKMGGRY